MRHTFKRNALNQIILYVTSITTKLKSNRGSDIFDIVIIIIIECVTDA